MSDPKTVVKNFRAKSGGVIIDGDVVGTTITTGRDVQVTEGATLEEFLNLLEELREGIRQAPLDPTVAEDLQDEAAGVAKMARRENPTPSLILTKLNGLHEVLQKAQAVATTLAPTAQRLVEMASGLF